MRVVTMLAAMVSAGLLGGCMSDGEVGNIFKRKATWADFVGGGDIKAACQPGSENRYRAVYNANRADQVRIYDVLAQSDGGRIRTRVLQRGITAGTQILPFAENTVLDPSDTSGVVSAGEIAALESQFLADGLDGAAPVGRRLFSGSFFWLVSGCVNGQFQFNAWEYPDPSYQALTFPETLFAQDKDPVAISHPAGGERITSLALRDVSFERSGFSHYDLVVEADGVSMGATYRNRDKF